MECGSAVTWPDTRRVYGEPRQCGIGYIGLPLFFVAFVDRAKGRRIIVSLRKANSSLHSGIATALQACFGNEAYLTIGILLFETDGKTP